MAEYEWAWIADRTRRGRLAKLRSGQLLPWVNTPDGYRCDPEHPRDPARLRIEETEASVVRQMFAWYTEEGLSMHAIVPRLTHLQIPTSRGGSHWHPATVKGILSNEVSAGTAYGNRDDEGEPMRWRGGVPRQSASAIIRAIGPATNGLPWTCPPLSPARASRESKRCGPSARLTRVATIPGGLLAASPGQLCRVWAGRLGTATGGPHV